MRSLPSEKSGLPEKSVEEVRKELLAIQAEKRRRQETRLLRYFPETGPLRRELYQKHMEHFRAGLRHRERKFMAAHRVGKTLAGGYEIACHLIGQYPAWWEGKRFNHPVRAVASGQTAKTTRDFIQILLFGLPTDVGTGLLPKQCILRTAPKHGLAEAYDTVYVQHAASERERSRLSLKSYDQGVDAYYGSEEEVHWCDEEPPLEIYTQCVIRTMTTGGIVIVTLTPLQGRTQFIDDFLRGAANREELEYK